MHRTIHPDLPDEPGPAWEVATLFPDRGRWAESDYLFLTSSTNRLVELTEGNVEVLPMPTMSHQLIVAFFYQALLVMTSREGLGTVLFAPLRVRLPGGTYREPDVVFMLAEHADRMGEACWDGADLAVEVVSDDNREHDLVTKRADYAAAGIPEYWIVDPREQAITVLKLAGEAYTEHGVFTSGQKATSALLPGFEIDVEAVWKAARK